MPSGAQAVVLTRYRDAYRVATALVELGKAIKVAGGVVAAIIVLGSLSSGRGMFGGGAIIAGLLLGAIVGILFWVCGVLVAAQGEILRATLDNSVASSHFLTDLQRADAMGLPRGVVRPGAHLSPELQAEEDLEQNEAPEYDSEGTPIR